MGRTVVALGFVVGIGALGAGTRPVMADVPSTVELAGAPAALTRLFEAPVAKPEWFTPAFLEQIPIDNVNAVIASVTKQFGAFRSVEGSGMDYDVHLARGSVHARVVVDHAGLIAGIVVQP